MILTRLRSLKTIVTDRQLESFFFKVPPHYFGDNNFIADSNSSRPFGEYRIICWNFETDLKRISIFHFQLSPRTLNTIDSCLSNKLRAYNNISTNRHYLVVQRRSSSKSFYDADIDRRPTKPQEQFLQPSSGKHLFLQTCFASGGSIKFWKPSGSAGGYLRFFFDKTFT